MSKFIAELKRRNVFKVATIYVVLSWLLLQVATIVFPVFDIPDWASRLVVLLLAIGFPIAMVLAWALELTPEGVEWDPADPEQHVHTHAWDWILGILLVVAIGMMVVSQLDRWQETGAEQATTSTETDSLLGVPEEPAPVERRLPSIAVLPFDSRSAPGEDDYFADGLSDELLSVLGRVSEIKVASRTSTAYFKDKNIDHQTIASSLMVDHVLSGTVRRYEDRIRVTAALDDTREGRLLWTEDHDRTLADILEIQSEIAAAVVAAVVPILSPESQVAITTKATQSNMAYDYYLRGRDYLRQPPERATLVSAVDLFTKAAAADPRFAEAFAGLCEAYLKSYEYSRDTTNFERAERSCHRALTLNSDLWGVHLALGNLYRINGQNDKAILELDQAIESQPNAVEPYLALARIYAAEGRLVDAESTFRRAESVESGYWGVHRAIGNFLYDQSRYEEAIERHQRVIDLAPDNGIGHDNLGNTYLALGDLESAARIFAESPLPSRWTHTNLGLVYYYQGEFAKAAEQQEKAIEMAPDEHRAWGRAADAYRFMPGSENDAAAAYEIAIGLAEKELTVNPDYWDSVIRQAIYMIHTGREDEAPPRIDRLFEITQDSAAFYFAAVATALLGDEDATYDFIEKSLAGGFSRSIIENDPDLASLVDKERFQTLFARY